VAQQLTQTATVLVTGATGFIGSHLAEQLLHDGHSVRCIVRPGRRRPSWIDRLPVEIVPASLTDVEALQRACHGVRTIVHVAGVTKAKRRRDYVRGNVEPTAALLKVARQLPRFDRFTYVSSLTAVGPSPDGRPLTEDAPLRPITMYGRSKLEAEDLVRQAMAHVPVTIIRPPAVYGPRDRDVLEMFRWVGFGLEPLIGDPAKSLSLVHVHDLARGICQATFDLRGTGKTYHVSEPLPHSFHDLVGLLGEIVHRRPIRIRIPLALLFALAGLVEAVSLIGPRPAVLSLDKARDMAQPHWVCDPGRIQAELGFQARVPIEEGLRTTFEWYREQGWL
jgi:nucleoside-diphosphate-sugar epimerase